MGTTTRNRAAGSQRGRKGISTVVAIAIFFMLFALAMTTVYSWQLMLGDYSEVGIQQLSKDNLRVAEKLEVSIISPDVLLLTNPTSQSATVRHVVSDGDLIWSGYFDVGPFSSASLDLSAAGGDAYRVVTMRGNVFSAGAGSQQGDIAEQGWHVKFMMNDTVEPGTDILNPNRHPDDDWGKSTVVGETYWYNTNLNWEWNFTSDPFGNLSFPAGTCVGFIATAKFVKVVDESCNATINYLIDTGDSNHDRSRVAFVIDGVLLRPLTDVWYDSSHYIWFTLEGPQYSVHNVTVYFYGKNVEVQKLSLNVVNATFAP